MSPEAGLAHRRFKVLGSNRRKFTLLFVLHVVFALLLMVISEIGAHSVKSSAADEGGELGAGEVFDACVRCNGPKIDVRGQRKEAGVLFFRIRGSGRRWMEGGGDRMFG